MGGLFFDYQPLVNLGTGRVLGAEALVRLQEEGGKVLPPEAFIPMAQRTGQIKTIDRWVLTEAMNTLRRWRRTGRNLGLAINLSSSRLEGGSLVGDIVREAKRAGVSPVGLTLEISEIQLFQLKERAAPLLRALREVGVSIALDDFGTGDGGLDWLTALPIDQVKIDRTYVAAMVHDSRCHGLLKEFVRVFLSRGLDVVAEGVETVRERDMLLAMGCRRGQGWLYGRPTSLEALETAAVRLPSQRHGTPR
jgi:EAL domain-containing protein (putative c-di-GMP-specific phosphodiesterase class I)